VADSGAGLAREQIEHIFDLDYTTKEKGLGFGLPLAHEIIRAHGGEIGVFSRAGGGTTFEIRLPREPRPGEPGVGMQTPRPKESI
jgi:signal transduction histidine kinase